MSASSRERTHLATRDPDRIETGDASGETPSWARVLVRTLDDLVRIPGTKQGVGLDPLIGLIAPGVGDFATSVTSLALLYLAVRQGVPTVVLLRMVQNLAIDALVGSIPILGDLFDAFYRANRRNLELIERHRNESSQPTAMDYAVVAVGLLVAIAAVALPVIVLVLLADRLGAACGPR